MFRRRAIVAILIFALAAGTPSRSHAEDGKNLLDQVWGTLKGKPRPKPTPVEAAESAEPAPESESPTSDAAPPSSVEQPPADSAGEPTTDMPSVLDRGKALAKQALDGAAGVQRRTRNLREEKSFTAAIQYAATDFILPSKYGVSAAYIRHADHSWELQYLRSSIGFPFIIDDLGSMTEQRASLISRHFFGTNSFNLSYGLSYNRFSTRLGSALLSTVSAGNIPNVDLVVVDSVGLNIALGNQWMIGNGFTIGVDWISLTQPVVTTKNFAPYVDQTSSSTNRDLVEAAITIAKFFPRFSFFKVQIGWTF